LNANLDIEDRLRAHLAMEREAIRTPANLELRVLRRLEEAPSRHSEPGPVRQLLLAAALVVFAAGLAFGIARLRSISGPIQPSPTATPTVSATINPSATPAATAITSPRPATTNEYDGMVAAGKPGAEQQLGIPDCGSTSPGPGHDCFMALGASDAIVGTDAGYFHGSRFGAGCWVYLYEDGAGWHYVDVRCAQAPGTHPRVDVDDVVNVSGCANVRADPGLQGRVVACLPNGTTVRVSGGPVYRDGKLWWYLRDRGWMVHDSLVS
jgi:hypothetical protein